MTDPIGTLKGVILDTRALGDLLPFYEAMFGPPKFVDGDRWAALGSAGAAGLNLAAGTEVTGRGIALQVKVADLAAAGQRILAAGGRQLGEPQRGPHEIRCLYADPAGQAIVVYQGL